MEHQEPEPRSQLKYYPQKLEGEDGIAITMLSPEIIWDEYERTLTPGLFFTTQDARILVNDILSMLDEIDRDGIEDE